MNNQVKSFIQVLSSNFFVSFSGIFTGILIPILLTEVEYGYWQYYLTYASYAALLLFGFCDGIYIRFGGEKYESLDKHRLNYMFFFMITMLMALTIGLLLFVLGFKIEDSMKRITLYAILISVFLQCVISFFTLLNQATGRFKIYSIGNTIERMILLIIIIACFAIKSLAILYLIIISIASKVVVVLYYSYHSRDIILKIPRKYDGWRMDVRDNFLIGLPITMCGIISLIMGGYGKMFIEWTSGMVNLAYYSFASSSISIISQVIVAASLVVFPSLKNAEESQITEFLLTGESVIDTILPILMLSYYPIVLAVKVIVSKYLLSMEFVPVILPMIFFQSKINVLYSNAYKVRRREKSLMLKGCIGLVSNVVLVSLFYLLTKNLMMVAVASTVSYSVWYFCLRIGMGESISFKDIKAPLYIVAVASSEAFCSVWPGLAVSITLSILYVIINLNTYSKTLQLAKQITK